MFLFQIDFTCNERHGGQIKNLTTDNKSSNCKKLFRKKKLLQVSKASWNVYVSRLFEYRYTVSRAKQIDSLI